MQSLSCSCLRLFRELLGVRVRVELGPRDAENGNCVLAMAGVPGTVANKKVINVDTQLRKEVTKVM